MHTQGYFDAIARDDRYRDNYLQQPSGRAGQKIVGEIYGFPITVDEDFATKHRRVAAWMPGEAYRTRPLVEQRFDYGDFHEAVSQAMRNAHPADLPPGADKSEIFGIQWTRENLREIEEAADRRNHNPMSFTDLGDGKIPTRTFKGEDGRTYEELDVRGEDTDPVLLNAKEEKRRLQEEGKRRLKEAHERAQRAQDELEEIEGFGSF